MRKVIKNSFIAAAMLFSVFMLISSAEAQNRRAGYTKAQIDRMINNLETRIDVFQRQFDRNLDRSRLDNSRREDVLNRKARNLEAATDELRREFNRRDRWIENKDEVRRCLNIASDINTAMRNNRFNWNIESNWKSVVYELNTLARVYNLPNVGASVYR
ncbi:MAG TPA: hypothetical protein PKY59_19575 [Pyrinomonadaceae bacterium]|nr:hypothetical protein [Pyrinomonadaceae bacterium]